MTDGSSFSKGGFMDSTFQGSESAGAETTRPGDKNSCLMPAWIYTVAASSLNSLQSYAGVTVNLIVIHGVVTSIDQSTTKVTMQVEDETGSIKVVTYLAPDDQESVSASGKKRGGAIPADVDIGHPVLVFGKPREEEEGRNYILSTFMCSLKENYARQFNHLLKVRLVEKRIMKFNHFSPKADEYLGTGMETGDYDDTNAGFGSEMTRPQQAVLELIMRANDTAHGISRDEIKKVIPTAMLSKVDEVLGFLVSEGHVYSTVTEDHFKTT